MHATDQIRYTLDMGTRRRGKAYCRLYADALRTPKLAGLDAELFRWWINLLMVATEYDGEGEGRLPDADSIAFRLNNGVTVAEVECAIHALVGHRLIDVDAEGEYRMHDYAEWQRGDVPTPEPTKPRTTERAKPTAAAARIVPAAEQVPGTTGRLDKHGRPLNRLQELVEAYCDALGMEVGIIGPQWGRYGKPFSGLAANGSYTYEDVYKLTGYVATMPYWIGNGSAPPPEQVVKEVGPWKARGKPVAWSPGPQIGNGRTGIGSALTRRHG
jgi:hypothetical protein